MIARLSKLQTLSMREMLQDLSWIANWCCFDKTRASENCRCEKTIFWETLFLFLPIPGFFLVLKQLTVFQFFESHSIPMSEQIVLSVTHPTTDLVSSPFCPFSLFFHGFTSLLSCILSVVVLFVSSYEFCIFKSVCLTPTVGLILDASSK